MHDGLVVCMLVPADRIRQDIERYRAAQWPVSVTSQCASLCTKLERRRLGYCERACKTQPLRAPASHAARIGLLKCVLECILAP